MPFVHVLLMSLIMFTHCQYFKGKPLPHWNDNCWSDVYICLLQRDKTLSSLVLLHMRCEFWSLNVKKNTSLFIVYLMFLFSKFWNDKLFIVRCDSVLFFFNLGLNSLNLRWPSKRKNFKNTHICRLKMYMNSHCLTHCKRVKD